MAHLKTFDQQVAVKPYNRTLAYKIRAKNFTALLRVHF